MNISLEIAWIMAVFLVSIRLGMVFVMTPLLSSAQVPVRIRVLFTLALSALIVAGIGITTVKIPASTGDLVQAAISEAVIGGVMAFGVMAAFAAFLLGGRIIDVQMGFGVAGLIDPATRSQAPLLGTFLNLLAVTVFFAVDGHHMVIRGIVFSLEHIPPGTALSQINLGAVVAQFGAMFIFGVMIVAPALFAILLLDIGLAVMARTMPQVNIFIVSLPLKILVGLIVTAISLPYSGAVMRKIYESIFTYWENLIG
jgi:flagellar biosynthetic protein FliR